jgi:translation initiation factor 5B
MAIRQPIITVCGHVDHGKTSILDRIRGTRIAEGEAGGITQKISFTTLPKDTIEQRADRILEMFKIKVDIPGFLLIDTPGHAAFTNLRRRGGSLADIAVLVIDINEGIKPQTAEVLQILKANKTPFIIALNKLDNISGWKSGEHFYESISKQAVRVAQEFDEKFFTIVGALNSYGFSPELYTKIKDFTKNIAVVPCSARTGEGISEIIAVLVALSQKFLQQRIALKEEAKGVILEVKKEKSINFLESIIYDGSLKVNDEIIIANFGKPIITKIRSLQEALPLSKGYKAADKVIAASGLRMQITAKEEVLPGMPFQIAKDLNGVENEFSKEISEALEMDEKGIFIKAESLGSLEALLFLLRQRQIQVIKADIGPVTKKDILFAGSLPEEDRVLLAFNSNFEEGVDPIPGVKIIQSEIVYKLIEDFEEWRKNKQIEMERAKLAELPSLVKLTILPFVFRNSNPAIFGVRVEAGLLKHDIRLINYNGEKVGHVKAMQHEKQNLQKAEKGKEIAMSMPGVTFDRQLKPGEILYSDLSETQFRKFKENKSLLTQDEIRTLQEIAGIKRRQSPTWGV